MAILTPDLVWLIAAAILAGLVRGFSGFGTSMVFLPVAGQILGPFEAITTLVVMDLVGPLPNVPRALKDVRLRDIGLLTMGLIVTLPLGIMLLMAIPAEVFRYLVSVISIVLLAALLAGFRYRGAMTLPLLLGTGAACGIMGGAAGLAGPPAILLYVSSAERAAVIRANTLLFLLLTDILLLVVVYASGVLVWAAVGTGVMLIVPYLLANVVGAAIFRPDWERAYRVVAYIIIAVSALQGLPLFD